MLRGDTELATVGFLCSNNYGVYAHVYNTVNFKLRNPHGYLSAVDFPALVVSVK